MKYRTCYIFFRCVTSLKDNESMPSPDHLMKFLVDQSSREDLEPCANCDEV